MRDINAIRGKCAFKTAKGHQFKKIKKKRKGVRDSREFG
jgi:hypothetical protein